LGEHYYTWENDALLLEWQIFERVKLIGRNVKLAWTYLDVFYKLATFGFLRENLEFL